MALHYIAWGIAWGCTHVNKQCKYANSRQWQDMSHQTVIVTHFIRNLRSCKSMWTISNVDHIYFVVNVDHIDLLPMWTTFILVKVPHIEFWPMLTTMIFRLMWTNFFPMRTILNFFSMWMDYFDFFANVFPIFINC